MWAARKPALLQTEWLRYKPKIEPSGKITVVSNLTLKTGYLYKRDCRRSQPKCCSGNASREGVLLLQTLYVNILISYFALRFVDPLRQCWKGFLRCTPTVSDLLMCSNRAEDFEEHPGCYSLSNVVE